MDPDFWGARWLRICSWQVAGISWVLAACGNAPSTSTLADAPMGDPSRPSGVAELPAGTVARVGHHDIGADFLESLTATQALSHEEALRNAVREALFAERAAADPATARQLRRVACARALLTSLQQAAKLAGPPSEDEVARATKLHWLQVDRPEMRRTTHAVVIAAERPNALASELAQRIATATANTRDAAGFRRAAETVIANRSQAEQSVTVKVEDLTPVTRDGRAVDPGAPGPVTTFDADFVRAVFELGSTGESTPVIESRFGYHVILLTEVVPEKILPVDERTRLFEQEILDGRARQAKRELLDQARTGVVVERARNADALTELTVARE